MIFSAHSSNALCQISMIVRAMIRCADVGWWTPPNHSHQRSSRSPTTIRETTMYSTFFSFQVSSQNLFSIITSTSLEGLEAPNPKCEKNDATGGRKNISKERLPCSHEPSQCGSPDNKNFGMSEGDMNSTHHPSSALGSARKLLTFDTSKNSAWPTKNKHGDLL